jgi:rhodanese-related sulfurtransferase
MPDLHRAGAFRACAVGVLSLLLASGAVAAEPGRPAARGPEALHDLQANPQERVDTVLFDLRGDSPSPHRDPAAYRKEASVVFACWSLSQRRCRDEVLRLQAAGHDKAFYLTGTPHEWVASAIAIDNATPERLAAELRDLRTIPVADLASARKDGTEFTLVDVRVGLGDRDARIAGAIAMPPAMVTEKKALLPKNGWIVLYDGGDGSAERTAAELRAGGYAMAVALAGGYPAWVMSEQR